MLILGLTGDIACGKSTVARLLQGRGAALLDADLLVRELYAEPAFARQVAALFNSQNQSANEGAAESANEAAAPRAALLQADGAIDRRALGAIVFGDAYALRRLEALVHPAVAALRQSKIEELRARRPPPRVVVLEAVKLVESGQHRDCDIVWWISCEPAVARRRLMQHRGLSAEEADSRLRHQPAAEVKQALLAAPSAAARAVPCVLIANNGTLEELENRVEEEWKKVMGDE